MVLSMVKGRQCFYNFLHECLCTIGVLGALGGQKMVSDPLELDLQMFMNLLVGTWN